MTILENNETINETIPKPISLIKIGLTKLGLDFPGFDLILLESQSSKEDSNYGYGLMGPKPL